jgi:hypothetical protein
MLEAIVQSQDELSKFLEVFRSVFRNKPQFHHFQAYLIGLLIYLGSRNLARTEPGDTGPPRRQQRVSVYRQNGWGCPTG